MNTIQYDRSRWEQALWGVNTRHCVSWYTIPLTMSHRPTTCLPVITTYRVVSRPPSHFAQDSTLNNRCDCIGASSLPVCLVSTRHFPAGCRCTALFSASLAIGPGRSNLIGPTKYPLMAMPPLPWLTATREPLRSCKMSNEFQVWWKRSHDHVHGGAVRVSHKSDCVCSLVFAFDPIPLG